MVEVSVTLLTKDSRRTEKVEFQPST